MEFDFFAIVSIMPQVQAQAEAKGIIEFDAICLITPLAPTMISIKKFENIVKDVSLTALTQTRITITTRIDLKYVFDNEINDTFYCDCNKSSCTNEYDYWNICLHHCLVLYYKQLLIDLHHHLFGLLISSFNPDICCIKLICVNRRICLILKGLFGVYFTMVCGVSKHAKDNNDLSRPVVAATTTIVRYFWVHYQPQRCA